MPFTFAQACKHASGTRSSGERYAPWTRHSLAYEGTRTHSAHRTYIVQHHRITITRCLQRHQPRMHVYACMHEYAQSVGVCNDATTMHASFIPPVPAPRARKAALSQSRWG
eukprot:4358548-Prymnesium_polylepis.1